MHFERHFAFQMNTIIYFSRYPKYNLCFTRKFTLKTGIVLFGLIILGENPGRPEPLLGANSFRLNFHDMPHIVSRH